MAAELSKLPLTELDLTGAISKRHPNTFSEDFSLISLDQKLGYTNPQIENIRNTSSILYWKHVYLFEGWYIPPKIVIQNGLMGNVKYED